MSIPPVVLVGLGAGIGGTLRYLLASSLDQHRWASLIGLPIGTMLVNILGSFILGLAVAMAPGKSWQLFLGTGMMGGFTTFSAFSVQTQEMIDGGRWPLALMHAAISVIVGVAAAILGNRIGTAIS